MHLYVYYFRHTYVENSIYLTVATFGLVFRQRSITTVKIVIFL